MLELKNVEKRVSVSLSICGYQFPKSKTDDWCLVKANFRQDEEAFEKMDPALEASEVFEIYRWFRALSENRLPNFSCLSFTEPCLSFEYLSFCDDNIRFSIKFSHELKPGFALNQFNSMSKDWSVVFELKQKELEAVTATLENICKAYSTRAKS